MNNDVKKNEDIDFNNMDEIINDIDKRLELLKQEELESKSKEEQIKINEQWDNENSELKDAIDSFASSLKDSYMSEIAKSVYRYFGVEINEFKTEKFDEINATVYIPKDNVIDINAVIVGEDKTYLTCSSLHPIEYYIEEFKNGRRDNLLKNKNLTNDNDEQNNKTNEFENNYISNDELYDYKLYKTLKENDFVLVIEDGKLLRVGHPDYDKDRVEIEIISKNNVYVDSYFIKINGKEYIFKSIILLNKIRNIIEENLNSMISLSKIQTKGYLSHYMLFGGGSHITLKKGNLIISLNGSVKGECEEFCKKMINQIKELIINEGKQVQ